ncbi:hypothetical protein ZOSMA_10G01590 [Zostera marina]|uniref:Uncharacterized protein n=1 Tax=Zostera marina TaxID=29655 RepID=A0A0K9Q5T0_ZOSMR|nr:hypothetical protein ZOSMA_10G01590 [Zostera marina]
MDSSGPSPFSPRILAGISQNPHFQALSSASDTIRTNVIRAYDETFLDAVAKIQSLSSDGDLHNLKASLQSTITQLENMGYDVDPLLNRIDLLEETGKRVVAMKESSIERIAEVSRRLEEKKSDLEEIKEEIARLSEVAEEKKLGIDALLRMVENLKVMKPEFDDSSLAHLAKAPFV